MFGFSHDRKGNWLVGVTRPPGAILAFTGNRGKLLLKNEVRHFGRGFRHPYQ